MPAKKILGQIFLPKKKKKKEQKIQNKNKEKIERNKKKKQTEVDISRFTCVEKSAHIEKPKNFYPTSPAASSLGAQTTKTTRRGKG